MRDFLKNIKVGDLVVISSRYHKRVRKVNKITPTGRICVDGITFNQDGTERGGNTWERHHLREATPELINELRREEIIQKAYKLMRNVTNITFEQATKILEILSPQAQENIT